MGIRPTDLLVGAEKELTLEGEVFLVEPIGPVSYVDVDVDGIAVKGVCDPDAAPAMGAAGAAGLHDGPRPSVRPHDRPDACDPREREVTHG